MNLRTKLTLCIGIAIAQVFILANCSADDSEIHFGVYPHLPSRDLEKVYSPIAAEFSSKLGKPVVFESSSSFENFNDRLDDEVFDIVFVQPFDYVRIADKYGYIPLAARGESLTALFAVKPASKIQKISDLKGKTVALPPSISAVSRLINDYLLENGIDPDKDVKIIHRRSHMSCLQQVLINSASACGTAPPVQRFFENKMKVKMRSVGETRSIPHTLFAIHPRFSKEKQELIKSTILSWGKSKKGKQILERGKLTPFQSITDQEYDVVRKIILQQDLQ